MNTPEEEIAALESDNASLHRQLERWHKIAIERAKERDDANERAFMSTESHAMTMQRAMKAEAGRDAALEQNTELDARCAKLEIERDFLAMANKDLSEAMNRYQELQQAAKLALEALDEATTYTSSPSWSPTMTDECRTAITALRQAGVQ